MPDRSDRRDYGEAHPAIDPQEQRRDAAVAVAARDPLGHDPEPAEEPDEPKQVPKPGRRQVTGTREVRWGGADIADDHEYERQGDRRRGSHEVDGQGKAAGVGRI